MTRAQAEIFPELSNVMTDSNFGPSDLTMKWLCGILVQTQELSQTKFGEAIFQPQNFQFLSILEDEIAAFDEMVEAAQFFSEITHEKELEISEIFIQENPSTWFLPGSKDHFKFKRLYLEKARIANKVGALFR